jgi:hypothetical protein
MVDQRGVAGRWGPFAAYPRIGRFGWREGMPPSIRAGVRSGCTGAVWCRWFFGMATILEEILEPLHRPS